MNLNFFYFLKNLLISQTFWKVYLHLFRSQFTANKEKVPLHGAWFMVTQSVTGMLTHCMVVTQFLTVRGCSVIIIDLHSHLYFQLPYITLPSCFDIPQFSFSLYIYHHSMFQLLLHSLCIQFSSLKNHTFQMAKNPVTVLITGMAVIYTIPFLLYDCMFNIYSFVLEAQKMWEMAHYDF